jgi:hypothetical protein
VASLPDQGPYASHWSALVVDQVRVVYPPGCTVAGVAVRVSAGTSLHNQTFVLALAVPPVPWQVIVKFVAASSAAVVCEPDAGSDPDHPPEAAQELAPVVDQLSVDTPPGVTQYLVLSNWTCTAFVAPAGWSSTLAAMKAKIGMTTNRRAPMRGVHARSAARRWCSNNCIT